MRIGIDLSITSINQAGTAVYTRNLLEALKKVDDRDEFLVFSIDQYRDMSERKTIRSRIDTIYRDIYWTHMVLPLKVKKSKADIIHMPANIIPLIMPCPTVVTILDAIIFQFPNSFPIWQRNYARIFIALAVQRAAHILTISKCSKEDIINRFHIPPQKITVTYLAASPNFRVLSHQANQAIKSKYNLGNFMLSVGALEPRKNIIRMIHAFALLRKAGYSIDLVHAGPKGWMFEKIYLEIENLGLEDSIRFLGRVAEDDLIGLYNAASVFVYPSLYEGFGLPVIEAMACGCPVITSNTSSLPEVVGEAGIMVDPNDELQLADAMQLVLDDKLLAHRLREKGLERSKEFSWQRCAKETLDVYRYALHS